MSTTPPRFSSPLVIRSLGGDRWVLEGELGYWSPVLGFPVTIPRGFVTDLESVPRWLPLVYALLKGYGLRASVVHDYLYQTHLRGVSRRQADDTLYEALRADGLDRVRSWMFWVGTRVGSGPAWESGPSRFLLLGNEGNTP